MKQLAIVRYTPDMRQRWNEFVDVSRNGTFLFHREYMEYHADRFDDYSLCFIYDGKMLAVLPAHKEGDIFCTHRGLTYGGLVLSSEATAVRVLEIVDLLLAFLRKNGFSRLLYKCVPYHLHNYPADEARYALFRNGATLSACNVATVVDMTCPLRWSELRRRGVRKAQAAGVEVVEEQDFSLFWPVLEQNLQERFGAKPVHTLEEIARLKALFPEQIRLYVARVAGEIVAGTVVYECSRCARVQYISASRRGKSLAALDLLFHYLLTERYTTYRYFDFGTSNEDDGRVLNEGLIAQKEGFGGRAVVYETYQLIL